MKRHKILATIIGGLLCFFLVYKLGLTRLHHPEYLLWSLSSRPCPAAFIRKYIYYDQNASALVKGLSEKEVLRRFPFAKDTACYPPDHYRRFVLSWVSKEDQYKGKVVKMYWLQEDMHLAIVVVDGEGQKIGLFKG